VRGGGGLGGGDVVLFFASAHPAPSISSLVFSVFGF